VFKRTSCLLNNWLFSGEIILFNAEEKGVRAFHSRFRYSLITTFR